MNFSICSERAHKYVVPKGFTRFLGKLSELTDMGVEVHYFTGNHDIWAYGYLEKECGVILHKKPETTELYGKIFFLAHGDGLGDPNKSFKLIRSIFHNRACQWAFSALHPRWGMWFGLNWAKHPLPVATSMCCETPFRASSLERSALEQCL